jgi:hypothetical protein
MNYIKISRKYSLQQLKKLIQIFNSKFSYISFICVDFVFFEVYQTCS